MCLLHLFFQQVYETYTLIKVYNLLVFITQAKAIELLNPYKPLLHIIISDNGKEFVNHIHISARIDIFYFFVQPYASWQRVLNENLNGMVRQYFPKKVISHLVQHNVF